MISLLCLVVFCLSLASNAHAAGTHQIFTRPGENVTLPCRLKLDPTFTFGMASSRIKWSKLNGADEIDVLVSMGFHKVVYSDFQGRAHLVEADDNDASLLLTNIQLDDFGIYKCDIINGMDDNICEVEIRMQGVVFPYSPPLGRYNLNFHDAEAACLEQDTTVASFEQLYQAWKGGLDWCNAGWLSDGTVQYPITRPREQCGGSRTDAGLRTYGRQNKLSRFDVFCFTSGFSGHVFFVEGKLTFDEATEACQIAGAMIAKVSHVFAAWKLDGYDRCDAGWLADGSVRYPISRPRMKCSPAESAVRFVGFPDKNLQLYGTYCYQAQQ
ncbi:hyaluronan and proteoglycan link protein 1a [Brachyhypopomus gauderio]|uniref:hyaluronan and proteoglycan link protein 1a n=1 Tax=Brachyhypopomus gauderio TaxID=698409 RepID=UPI004043219E